MQHAHAWTHAVRAAHACLPERVGGEEGEALEHLRRVGHGGALGFGGGPQDLGLFGALPADGHAKELGHDPGLRVSLLIACIAEAFQCGGPTLSRVLVGTPAPSEALRLTWSDHHDPVIPRSRDVSPRLLPQGNGPQRSFRCCGGQLGDDERDVGAGPRRKPV